MIPRLAADFESAKHELGDNFTQASASPGMMTRGVEKAIRLNWRFYNAPTGRHRLHARDLHQVDSVGVGMYLQTCILRLTARGLGTCVQMLIAGSPDVVRETLHIPNRYEMLCGLAIGYAVEDFPANNLDVPRKPIEDPVGFYDQ